MSEYADVWKHPRCLVEFSVDGQLIVNEETLQALHAITVPLVVVSVVGPYRTGKSYLMNRLVSDTKRNGFSVGSTVQGHTKGIWIWCRPHPKRQNCCLVLMDTEGLVDCERANKTDDTYIFSLTLLLSSTLVYNCKHALDKTALDSLHFVTVATEHIKIKSNSGGQNGQEEEEAGIGLDKYFPVFVVAVRDFTLELEWEGNPVTEDEYLERILNLRKGKSKAVADYNLPRECIRSFFPSRKCFMFPCPVKDDKQLKHLEELPDDELSEQFRDKRDKFTEYVLCRSEPKKVDINPINGRAFASLTRCYVEAIAKGSICVESAVETMARAENQKVAAEALDIYQEEFRKLVQFPTDTVDEMSNAHGVCQKKATEHFLKHCICDYDNSYKQQFLTRLREVYNDLYCENATASANQCTQLLHHLHGCIVNKDYACPGGYRMYQEDMQRLKTEYDKQQGKGILAKEKWNEFMAGQIHIETQIMNADKSMEGAEKAHEEERRAREISERMLMAVQEAERKMEHILREQEISFQQQMKTMSEQMEQDKRDKEKEFEAAQEARRREQQRLLKEGLDESAKLQMETVKMLKEEQQRSAREAKENWQLFERMIAQSNEERKDGIQALREELTRSMEQARQMSERLQALQNEPKPAADSGGNVFFKLASGIIHKVTDAFIGKIFPVPVGTC